MSAYFNAQPPEKPIDNASGKTLDVKSIYETIQGEGPLAGYPCVFVRLAGCNLDCPLCDTDYTNGRESINVGDVAEMVLAHKKRKLVVITGGEPFRQSSLPLLTRMLGNAGRKVQIETNGTLWQPVGKNTLIVCSPKMPVVRGEVAAQSCAYKYILEHDKLDPIDGLPTSVLGNGMKPARPPAGFKGEIFVQPLDSFDAEANRLNYEATVVSAMEHGYRISVQSQKIVGVS